ncbi:MAG: hypothetical protein QG635_222 [Bacteroidota bacterium]|nr:hypothetical protein [Bacteroidota bacterium]
MKTVILCLVILLFSSFITNANNLTISNLSLTGQDNGYDYVMVQFDISWENSWRVSSAPNNWDAAWLFVKYKKASDGLWYHATLNTTAANHSAGSQGTSATIYPRSDGKGIFFYRSGDGSGTFTSTAVQLRWGYGSDGMTDDLNSDISNIQVFGIEMVYVPQGAFYVGSGGSEYEHFFTYPNNTYPYQINSESEIIVGAANSALFYTNSGNGGDQTGPIPAAFPKGYNAFYCMKYEITQEQYVAFLNTLTRNQQGNRVATDISGTSITNRFVMSNSNTMLWRNGIKCDASIPSSPTTVTFYCDYNGNGTGNEASDGQNIACNWLSWADGAAYSDWSGLRPMTELEFEKACRGIANPVANEFAWGSTTIQEATGISNSGQASEAPSNATANCVYNANSNVQGPMRVVSMTSSSRSSTGGSFYGIMEMSGNLWERAVTVGNSTGRGFTGVIGNGILNYGGNADASNWPGTDANGSGCRGGSWFEVNNHCTTSSRHVSAFPSVDRGNYVGFRCVSGL